MSGGYYDLAGKRVWVAGHRGMVGSALARRLQKEIGVEVLTADRTSVDLTRQLAVENWIDNHRPTTIIIAAAKVGGIWANNAYPADFLYDNLMIEANIMNSAAKAGVEKLLFLGSSCIYPKMAPQPIQESSLLTGPLEETNEWYAIAKIAGLKLAQAYRRQSSCDFISAMPTNLYGPGDNYDLQTSHVIPALLRKVHLAKKNNQPSVEIWGTGTPRREFMHVDDLADAIVFLLKNYSENEHINIGCGTDLPIASLAELICRIVGFDGKLHFDTSKPDGTPRKLMDSSRLYDLGWSPSISLEAGLAMAYQDAREQL